MADPDIVNPDTHMATPVPLPPGRDGDAVNLSDGEAAAWAEAGVVNQARARILQDSGISPAEVQRYRLGPPISAGRVPTSEAVTVLRALRPLEHEAARGRIEDPQPCDAANELRASNAAVVFVRKLTGQLRPLTPPITTEHSPNTRQVKQIAGGAIRHYERVRRHDDATPAWSAAVRHAVTIHAASPRGQLDGDGDPKPAGEEVRAIAEAAVGLYSGYVEDHGLASRQAWERTLEDVLAAWAPPGLSAAAWWLEEQVQEEVGTRAQRAEVAVVLAAYNNEEGWLDRVPEFQAKAVDAAIQHDALRPTRRLRAQVTAAVQLLKQRPQDQAAKLRGAQGVVAKLRSFQTVLERRPLTPAGRNDPVIDYEHGLAQVAVRLRAANRQVAELEAAQRLGREWDDAQAFELARAEAAALALRARELALTARLEAYRPPWLRAAVGPAPADPTRRAGWRRGVLAVLRWRVDHDVVDQTRALGPEPTDPADLRRHRQAVRKLSGIERSIGHTPVLAGYPDRTRAEGRQPGQADLPQPALPGTSDSALGRGVGDDIGVDLP